MLGCGPLSLQSVVHAEKIEGWLSSMRCSHMTIYVMCPHVHVALVVVYNVLLDLTMEDFTTIKEVFRKEIECVHD